MYPGKMDYSVEEIAIATRVLCSCDVKAKEVRRLDRLPWVFIPIGERVKIKGKTYECIKAGKTLLPSQACSGCALKIGRIQCAKYQCSPQDRPDGKFTWFKEVMDNE